MKQTKKIIFILSFILMSFPIAAHAFWGFGSDSRNGLNLETGYDANTVTTVTGRIVTLQTGDDHSNAQLELESNGVSAIVVLGPQSYWAEKGIPLKAGDYIMVRGSKAQGKDGAVYILAEKITDRSLDTTISLRNESGQPAWRGGSIGSGAGRMNNRPVQIRQQSPGRAGGGRMGR